MTEPRRRGRPAGSRNRARVTTRTLDLDPSSMSKTNLPDWTPADGMKPSTVTIDADGWRGMTQLEPMGPSIRVVIQRRQSFSDAEPEREIAWPASWRLPQQGEAVHVSKDLGGLVSSLDFNVERGVVIIHIR